MKCINAESMENTSPETPKTPSSPKRLRSSMKSVTSDLDASHDSKLDESLTTSPISTPKSHNKENGSPKLTPKQLQKKQEAAKRREEREKEKLERDKKKQEEKDERARVRQEKEDQRKKEREEKEEHKRKEKEEKERQKELEKKQKEEKEEQKRKEKEEKEEQRRKEKEEKEEQRRKEKEAKEEEKRKKQEALELEKQEQELKKKKAAEAFVNFFVPKQKVDKDSSTNPISKNSMLSSFTIKSDMRLAPTVRCKIDDDRKEKLVTLIENQEESTLYLKLLKDGLITPGCSSKTWPIDDKDDDDVILVEDDLPSLEGVGEVISSESAVREKLKPKLFSFQENRRPPYWGTWRKRSHFIKPRKPFSRDEKQLDYEVDSDEEWEDEGEGESVDDDGSEDEAEGDEYEVDNEFFVPHGYLSDEEATMDGDDVLSLSPEAQKAKLKHLEDEFETELKKPTEKLKPRLYGLLWETKEGGKPENCVDALWNYFDRLSMIMHDPTPLLQPSQESEDTEKKKVRKRKSLAEGEQNSPKSDKRKKQKMEKSEVKTPKSETKKSQKPHPKPLKNQPGINSFLKKLNTT